MNLEVIEDSSEKNNNSLESRSELISSEVVLKCNRVFFINSNLNEEKFKVSELLSLSERTDDFSGTFLSDFVIEVEVDNSVSQLGSL